MDGQNAIVNIACSTVGCCKEILDYFCSQSTRVLGTTECDRTFKAYKRNDYL